VVQSLLNASVELTGRPESARSFPGATDGPHLKTPAVVCGPGSLSQAHSIDEFVEIEQCVRATKMYLRAVTDLVAE
jgi:acetylornithine deacetylase/succinyl-diaminopimelate desuccinylase-like protein